MGPKLHVDLDPRINLAAQQNGVHALRSLAVSNPSDAPLQDLTIEVTTDPAFAAPNLTRVETLAVGATYRMAPVDLAISPSYLLANTERQAGYLWVEIRAAGIEPTRVSFPVEILAPTEWPGLRSLPELLAAFVTPNALGLAPLLKEVSARMLEATGNAALDGYQSKDRSRVATMASAVYATTQALGIAYSNPPASFEATGQKIRSVDQILTGKLATCVDLTVFMASLLEQCGLHPLLLITEGHAFPGVWLTDFMFPEPAVDDPGRVSKRVRLSEGLVFDSSAAAHGAAFRRACDVGLASLEKVDGFRTAIDVRRARKNRIQPIQLQATPLCAETDTALGFSPFEVVDVPELSDRPAGPEKPATRLDRWRSKLLDLSLRNRLLNFRETKQTLRLAPVNPFLLEDTLAAGSDLALLPRILAPGDPCDPAAKELALRTAVLGEQQTGRLRTQHEDSEFEKRTLELFRRARTQREETGTNTLYLAVGMLEWLETPSRTEVRHAPLLLIPVELSKQDGYRLKQSEEESRVNVTLLKKLTADFGLDTSELERIPEDESGLDVQWAFERFTRLIKDKKGWNVRESCYLAEFSFAKFLMWQDLQANFDKLHTNPVVRHILEGRGEAFGLERPVTEDPDAARSPKDLLCGVDADPTQLQAILAAEDGSSFVLQGPPGTGKSQTITNLVMQLLARGKSVLFVSEKMAALDVVHARLSRLGLAPFCLELHSHQANKAAVMRQLQEPFQLGAREPQEWLGHASELEKDRDALNAFASVLGKPTEFGPTVQGAISQLIGLRQAPLVALSPVNMSRFGEMKDAAQNFASACQASGEFEGHVWQGAHCTDWTPAWQRDVESTLQELDGTLETLRDQYGRVLALFGLSLPDTWQKLDEVAAIAQTLIDSPRPPRALLTQGSHADTAALVESWCSQVNERQHRWTALSEKFTEKLFELDLDALATRYKRWGQSFFLVAFFMLFSARQMLKSVARGKLPNNTGALLEVATEIKRRDQSLDKITTEARVLLGRFWQGAETRVQEVLTLVKVVGEFRSTTLRATNGEGDTTKVIGLYSENNELLAPGSEGRKTLDDFAATRLRARDLDRKLASLLRTTPEIPSVAALQSKVTTWRSNTFALRDWCAVQRAREKLVGFGLSRIVEAAEKGTVTPANIGKTVERSVLQAWWEDTTQKDPQLRSFHGREHEQLISRFKRLDREVQRLAREVVRARLAARTPTLSAPGDEMALLRRQFQLQRRHMPMRRLFSQIPSTLRRLKPCVLMSPLSVAQFLDPAFERFDVVVFDEASQIPPWDAIGAIARGKQVIIVGDSKQLPPTTFFAAANDEDEEEVDEDDRQDVESVLDEAVASGLQQLSLRWHYRSRHESLIAFSNHHYYEGRLNTFPSSDQDVPNLGVKLRRIDGQYDRGASRQNRAEAIALVDELFRILRSRDNRSVGIVTFSSTQQRLIEDMVEAQRAVDAELDGLFRAASEPVFIKNLENVQGDERDIMLFSVCYGPDRAGKVTMNFGPLNRDGGERRLNVAITRAREQLLIFSSLDPDQIDLRRTRARGVAHMRTFLDYATRGMVAIDAVRSLDPSLEPDSPFELEVKHGLESRGWTVHSQIGTSGYHVDLAVLDKDQPGRYILGIECDGATYHSSRCARERDRLRQEVLENLGWKIHRIWSTEWWLNPEKELDRVEWAIRTAPVRTIPKSVPPPRVLPKEVEPEVHPRFDLPTPVLLGSPEEFYLVGTRAKIASRVLEVVRASGPMLKEHVFREVAGSFNLSSVGKRIREVLEAAVSTLGLVEEADTLWSPGTNPKEWRGFRVPGMVKRNAEEIPEREVANAAAWVLNRAKTISPEDLAKETAKTLGIGFGKKVKESMDRGIDRLVVEGRGRREGSRILAVD